MTLRKTLEDAAAELQATQERLDATSSDPQWLNESMARMAELISAAETEAATVSLATQLTGTTPEQNQEAMDTIRYLGDKLVEAATINKSRPVAAPKPSMWETRGGVAITIFGRMVAHNRGEDTLRLLEESLTAADIFLAGLSNEQTG